MTNWTLGQLGKTNPKRTQNEPKRTQNEPKFKKAEMNVTAALTKGYENKSNWAICENEPKTNPIKANKKPKRTKFKTKQIQSRTPAIRRQGPSRQGPKKVTPKASSGVIRFKLHYSRIQTRPVLGLHKHLPTHNTNRQNNHHQNKTLFDFIITSSQKMPKIRFLKLQHPIPAIVWNCRMFAHIIFYTRPGLSTLKFVLFFRFQFHQFQLVDGNSRQGRTGKAWTRQCHQF